MTKEAVLTKLALPDDAPEEYAVPTNEVLAAAYVICTKHGVCTACTLAIIANMLDTAEDDGLPIHGISDHGMMN